MLQWTIDLLTTDTRLSMRAIAFCTETGANLFKSGGQYVLGIPLSDGTDKYSRWSRRTVLTDEDAFKRAQRAIDRHLKSLSQPEESNL